jgi:hydroxyacyl-ACP dehydratase HTD2-like protein with hotdog domain
MNHLFKVIVLTLGILITNMVIANTLSNEAQERGINSTCVSYLGQIEESYDLNGLNITFAHQNDPSLYPSLHISNKKYNNGSTVFSASLSPDGEYCYVSTVNVTQVNTQNCNDITMLKVAEDSTVNVEIYADGDFYIISPEDNSYQIILTDNGEQSCTMVESRMMWPGR